MPSRTSSVKLAPTAHSVSPTRVANVSSLSVRRLTQPMMMRWFRKLNDALLSPVQKPKLLPQ